MNIQQWRSGSKGQCALHLLHIEHAKLMSGHRGFPDYQETFSNRLTAEVWSVAAAKVVGSPSLAVLAFTYQRYPLGIYLDTWHLLDIYHVLIYLQFYWVLLCLACLLISLTIFVQLDIYHVLIYLQLYLVLVYFVYLLISWTIFVHLHGFIVLVPSLLRSLSGVSMTKSGQSKSKSNKSN